MNLDVSRINDLATVVTMSLDMFLEELPEDIAVSPTEMKTVNGITFPILLRELIPLAPGDHDPPNSIQCFSEIRWFSSSPKNVSC